MPDANDPNDRRLEGPKPDQLPAAMEFLGRPFDEALLFEIASALNLVRNAGGLPRGSDRSRTNHRFERTKHGV